MADARRRLSAILAADVVGYSRLVGLDEAGTVARVRALFREVAQPEVARAGGRVFKAVGDGFLAEFPSAVAAVTCAAAIQAATEARAAAEHPDRRIRARIGVHLGDVLVEGTDLFGDGVNVAARLEGLAEPGGVVLSAPVADAVRGRIPEALEDLGERALKNIERSIRVFRVAPAATPAEPPRLAVPERPSLVVLPFQNLSGDPEQEYFADGMVEDITTALSRIRWLFVIARNSAFTYKGRAVDVRQVGRELGVRYVLEGSVRKAGNRVRITGQLIEAETGRHVWADRFDGDLADIFELQDRVTEALCGAIEPNLQRAESERAHAKPTENLDAYDLYLRALPPFYSLTRAGSDQAVALLRQAIELDPRFVLGKAYAAYVMQRRHVQGWGEPDEPHLAARLAREALAVAGDDATVLRFAGQPAIWFGEDRELGLAATERALSINPNSAQVVAGAAWSMTYDCQPERAITLFERALRLNPLDPEKGSWQFGVAMAYYVAGRYENCIEMARQAIALNPVRAGPYRALIPALYALGRVEEAREVVHAFRAASPAGAAFIRLQRLVTRLFTDPDLVPRINEAMRAAGAYDD